MLVGKRREKKVKRLKIYSFSELFPNPKQSTMMHAWWCQPKGNKNKFKILSLVPKRLGKGNKLWFILMNDAFCFFSLTPIWGIKPAQIVNFWVNSFQKATDSSFVSLFCLEWGPSSPGCWACLSCSHFSGEAQMLPPIPQTSQGPQRLLKVTEAH